MKRRSSLGLATVVLVATACGSDSKPAATAHETPPDSGADAAVPSSTDGGGTEAGPGDGAAPVVTDYSKDDLWLCLPGKTGDICHENLDATVLHADGTTELQKHVFATDPAVDCFYVYPTISTDGTPNSDLVPDAPEKNCVRDQAARLSRVCNVFAPVYRQVTLAALLGSLPNTPPDREMPYADVLAAWNYFLENHSKGRPFVLAGHSQGAGVLRRLVQEQIENDDALRGRLVSAFLIGGGLTVPDGMDGGSDFSKVPVCKTATDTGCAVAYSSFRATAPPPADSLFGKPRGGAPGVTVCANPAALGGGPAVLQPYFSTSDQGLATVPGLTPGLPTPFVTFPDFLRGECVAKNGFDYLEVTLLTSPTDQRPTDISGDLTPQWGLHLVDMNIAMGDIVDLVGSQVTAYLAK